MTIQFDTVTEISYTYLHLCISGGWVVVEPEHITRNCYPAINSYTATTCLRKLQCSLCTIKTISVIQDNAQKSYQKLCKNSYRKTSVNKP